MHKRLKHNTVLLLTLLVLLLIVVITKPISYGIRTRPSPKLPKIEDQNLYKEIQEYAKDHNQDPIDAVIDRVWKAIPGYNGRKVNVEASYKKMAKDKVFDESKIVYDEEAPKIHLNDLDPQPIYRGNPQKPMVAPLINVAWGNEFIPTILETLEKHKIKVTFFFDGSWVKKNPDLAKIIKEASHEIGNHAYSHPDLSRYSPEQTTEEISKTNQVIEETIGVRPIWFAPPSGAFNDGTIQVAHKLNMKTILWTVDTIDWRNPETTGMVSRVVGEVENGSMILMHPTKPTAEGLNTMIEGIKAKGYKLATVSQLMDEKRID